MSRIVLILSVWVFLAALVAGVACLARDGGERGFAPPALKLAQSTSSGTDARVTVTPVSSTTPPASASILPALASTAIEPSAQPISHAISQPISSSKSVAQEPAPAPPKPAPAPDSKPQKPARPEPSDDDDGPGIPGLGRLPKGVPPEYEGLGVICVSAATGRPIADVKVRSLTQKELDEWTQRNPGLSVETEDPESVLAASSTNVKTSVHGVAIAPSGPGKMLVDAKLGVLYAYAWVDRDKVSQVKLEMVEDREVVFQTRGPDGAPQPGLPVVVYEPKSCREIWRGTTQGEEATVRMRHAAFVLAPELLPCQAWVDGVWYSAKPVTLQRLKLPLETQILTVPATHAVLVRVKDPEGALVTIPVGVRLGKNKSPEACGTSSLKLTRNGEATFERVETNGSRKLALAVSSGGVFEPIELQVEGGAPIIEASFTRRYPVARLQLVDTEGKPVAGASTRAWIDRRADMGDFVPATLESVETAADGSVRFPLACRRTEKRPPSLQIIVLDKEGNPTAGAVVPLENAFDSVEPDLGKVKVADLPVLAQGYVVNDREAAISGAEVHLFATNQPDVQQMSAIVRLTVVTDHTGFFKFRGLVDEPHLAISAQAAGHSDPRTVSLQRGDKKVKIVLPRVGTLVSKVLLPPGLPSDSVRLQVSSPEYGGIDAIPGGNDIHRAVGLPPGKASVNVFVRETNVPSSASSEQSFSIDDVEVKPGIEVSDPRVNQIDLKQHMLWIQLHVTDPDGKDIDDGSIFVVERGDGQSQAPAGGAAARSLPIRGGFARIATRKVAVDVLVSVAGFEPIELKEVDKDTDVHLVREK